MVDDEMKVDVGRAILYDGSGSLVLSWDSLADKKVGDGRVGLRREIKFWGVRSCGKRAGCRVRGLRCVGCLIDRLESAITETKDDRGKAMADDDSRPTTTLLLLLMMMKGRRKEGRTRKTLVAPRPAEGGN